MVSADVHYRAIDLAEEEMGWLPDLPDGTRWKERAQLIAKYERQLTEE